MPCMTTPFRVDVRTIGAILFLLANGLCARIASGQVDASTIDDAIDAIIAELDVRRDESTFWEPDPWIKRDDGEPSQSGGYTALVTLALLTAGESYQSPRLREAIEFLETAKLEGTYAVATRTLVWARLPEKFRPNLERDTTWLLGAFSRHVSGWTYEANPNSRVVDNSVTLFGAMALHAAADRGVRVDPRVWRALEQRFVQLQLEDGGWAYRGGDRTSTGSMTTAALTVLHITQERLHLRDHVPLRAGRTPSPTEQAMQRGFAWLDRQFTATENPGDPNYHLYALWGAERVALESGRSTFGRTDWLRAGAAAILAELFDETPDGLQLRTTLRSQRSRVRTDDLAFAMLFLARGRAPIAVNKLRWGDATGRWNNRPRDAANLASSISVRTERDLHWQTTPIDADPLTWLDASFLLLTSDESPDWIDRAALGAFVKAARAHVAARAAGKAVGDPPARPASRELDAIRTYLDRGGLLVCLAEGRGRLTSAAVRVMGEALYPACTWETAGEDHWAHTLGGPAGRRRPTVEILSNGVRPLIVLVPEGDATRFLHLRDERRPEFAATLTNVYLHASAMDRPVDRLIEPTPIREPDRPTFTVVRAVHPGRWKPEPLALPLVRTMMLDDGGGGFVIRDAPLTAVGDLLPPPALVTVSGVDRRGLDAAEVTSLVQYVRAGGTVLIETVGGVGGFAAGVQEQVESALGATATPLLESSVITGADLTDGADARTVGYTAYALRMFGARESTPRLRGILIDGAPRVLISDVDLSHGVLGRPQWGIVGYDAASARRILRNILAWAARDAE